MIVTFISQCQKKAIKRTRKILDAFAGRIGDNVWQTNITEIGLKNGVRAIKIHRQQINRSRLPPYCHSPPHRACVGGGE